MLQWIKNKFKTGKGAASGRKIFLLAVFVLLFAGATAHAQVTTSSLDLGLNQNIGNTIGLATTDLRIIIARIIRVALSFVGVVLVVIMLYAGFLWLTSQGNEEQIGRAKKIMVNGAVGLAIILSSYAIVSFIISKLLEGVNGQGGGLGNRIAVSSLESNFFGSGALGSVIRDHYPGRGQRDVPRNAKIIITFRRAVVPASFINDTSGNGTFGDCRNIGQPTFNWENDCDTLRMDNNFISIFESGSSSTIRGASALASVEAGGVYTVVIRPFDPLGSDAAKMPYTVHIGPGVTFDDPANGNPSVFNNFPASRSFYEWGFVCDTVLDRTPPHIVGVFPGNNVTESMNSIVQINFDKPMDPSTLQGTLSAGAGFYVLRGNSLFLRSNSSTLPAGDFRLVNNYQTLEFAPGTLCGRNSCGRDVFCMPVCDRAGANCTNDRYEVLLRAAQTFANNSFEAVPFSGVMDVSGNALDGNNNGRVDAVARTANVFPDEAAGDNYNWRYNLNNTLDLTAPYLNQVTPGIDASYIEPNADLTFTFSKRMRAESVYNISLFEQPIPTEPVCYVPRALFNPDGTTLVRMDHCPFISDSRHYYYPLVDSSVEDTHFNCFYPGVGPTGLDPATKASTVCDSANPTNCCVGADPLCCNGITTAVDRNTCLNNLRAASPP